MQYHHLMDERRRVLGNRSIKDMVRVFLFPFVFSRRVARNLRLKNFVSPRIVNINYRGNRFAIIVDPKNGFVDRTIYITETWDERVGDALCRFLKKGSVFVDVGTNIGFFSLLASRIVSEEGKVFSFEPIPHCVEQVKKSVSVNKDIHNITIFPFACGVEEGSSKIYLHSSNVGGSSLSSKIGKSATSAPEKELNVRIAKMDSVLGREDHIDVIKIDVEGMEFAVLRGAENMLKKHRPILVIEYSPFFYEQIEHGMSEAFVDFIREHRYVFFDIWKNKIIDIEDTTKELLEARHQLDIVCLPEEHSRDLLA